MRLDLGAGRACLPRRRAALTRSCAGIISPAATRRRRAPTAGRRRLAWETCHADHKKPSHRRNPQQARAGVSGQPVRYVLLFGTRDEIGLLAAVYLYFFA